MKRISYLVLFVLIILLTSCKTHQEVTSANNNVNQPKYTTKTALHSINSNSGSTLLPEEVEIIHKLARELANIYCEKTKANNKISKDPNNEQLQNRLVEVEQKFIDKQAKVDSFCSTELRSAEFDRAYNEMIIKCK